MKNQTNAIINFLLFQSILAHGKITKTGQSLAVNLGSPKGGIAYGIFSNDVSDTSCVSRDSKDL